MDDRVYFKIHTNKNLLCNLKSLYNFVQYNKITCTGEVVCEYLLIGDTPPICENNLNGHLRDILFWY